jgi:hypothetical protein
VNNVPTMNASSSSEIEKILSTQTRIDRAVILNSAPYTPYTWSVFFIYSAIIVASLWLLYKDFIVGDVQPYGFLNFFLISAYVGVFLVPIVVIFYLLNLLFPTRLLIDEVVVTMSGCGKKRDLNGRI